MKKYYKVYSVDFNFEDYAMDYRLIGAENEDDLISHLGEFVDSKKRLEKIVKEKEWRIEEVKNLYTDVPYEILDSYGYME